jgi:hypothetical protein
MDKVQNPVIARSFVVVPVVYVGDMFFLRIECNCFKGDKDYTRVSNYLLKFPILFRIETQQEGIHWTESFQ